MNVTSFPKRAEAETPKMRPRVYAVMGYCATGFLMGHVIRHIDERISDDDAFRHLVDEVFKDVPGLRFGMMLGPQQMAQAPAESAE